MNKTLNINNLNYRMYENFNLTIDGKQFVSIIGSNNSGKSTLYRLVSGIIPTNNVINCCGINLNRENINNYIKQLGLVFTVNDNYFLFDNVCDELSYPLKNLGYSKNYIVRSISKILNLFSLDIKDKKIDELSKYEKQCLLFCLALIHNPKVLIIDDVFNYMDKKDIKNIIDILKKTKNLCIINFTSNFKYCDECDYIYVLDNGQIKLEGNYEDILKQTNILIKLGIELPFVVKLSNKLKEEGIVKKDYCNLEELVKDVWE